LTNRYCLKALDWPLKDILNSNAPFCGKVIIMCGDFCEVLLVIQKDTKTQMCIIKSHLWSNTKVCIIICDQCMITSLQDFLA
jgi:hypothetical protein